MNNEKCVSYLKSVGATDEYLELLTNEQIKTVTQKFDNSSYKSLIKFRQH